MNSESNVSSALGVDSSQESLVLPSLDLDRLSPLEDQFNTFISTSSVLSPHSGASSSFALAATASNNGSSLIHQSPVPSSVTENVPQPPSSGGLSDLTPSYSLLSSNSNSSSTVTPLNNPVISVAEMDSAYTSSSSYARNNGSRYGLVISRSSSSFHAGSSNNFSGRLSLTSSEPRGTSSVSHEGLPSLLVPSQNVYSVATCSSSNSIPVPEINTISSASSSSSSITFVTPRPSVRFMNLSNSEAIPISNNERTGNRSPSDDIVDEIL